MDDGSLIGEEAMWWAMEFEKIKDKDDLNDIIGEDTWFYNEADLFVRVKHLFDLSESTPPPPLPELPTLPNPNKEGVNSQGDDDNQRQTNKTCLETRVKNPIIVQKTRETLKRKTSSSSNSQGDDDNQRQTKKICLESRVKNPILVQKKKKKNVRASNLKVTAVSSVVTKEKKMTTAQIFAIPYAERVEMAKRKLQQSYDQCKDSRKTTCLIDLSDLPKPLCPPRRPLPKPKRVVRSCLRHNDLPVSRKMATY